MSEKTKRVELPNGRFYKLAPPQAPGLYLFLVSLFLPHCFILKWPSERKINPIKIKGKLGSQLKHENLSLAPSTHIKADAAAASICNPRAGGEGAEAGRSLGLVGHPLGAKLAQWLNPRSMRDFASKYMMESN